MQLNKAYATFRGRGFKYSWPYGPLMTLLWIVLACLALEAVGAGVAVGYRSLLSVSRLFGLGEFFAQPFMVNLAEAAGYGITFALVIALFSQLADDDAGPRILPNKSGDEVPLVSWSVAGGNAAWAMFGKTIIMAIIYALLPLPTPYSPAGAEGLKVVGTWGFLPFVLSAVVLAPILEELLFRWLFLNWLRASFRSFDIHPMKADLVALVLSSAVFAAVHGTLSGFPALFVSGMFLGALYRDTGDLRSSILLHALNNTLAVVALVVSTKL